MRAGSQSRDTDVALPGRTMRAMWECARRSFDVTEGGRFDARSGTTMLVWSSPLTEPGAEPIGAFTVRWDKREPDLATVQVVAWVPELGGSEAQVWRAIKVLAGADWPAARASRRRAPEARSAA